MVGLQPTKTCKRCGKRCHFRLRSCPYCSAPLDLNTSVHLPEEDKRRSERISSSKYCLPPRAEDGGESSRNLSDSSAENSVASWSSIEENIITSQRNAPVQENSYINLSAIKKSAMHCIISQPWKKCYTGFSDAGTPCSKH